MRSFLNSICMILLAGSLAAAQTAATKPTLAKASWKAAASALRSRIFPQKLPSTRSCINSLAISPI